MSDLIGFLETLNTVSWVNVLVLIGLCGGLVFAVWIVGGALADIGKVLLLRPTRRLGAHIATSPQELNWGSLAAAALTIGGSLSAIVWVMTQ